jgi:hypothetical protein
MAALIGLRSLWQCAQVARGFALGPDVLKRAALISLAEAQFLFLCTATGVRALRLEDAAARLPQCRLYRLCSIYLAGIINQRFFCRLQLEFARLP